MWDMEVKKRQNVTRAKFVGVCWEVQVGMNGFDWLTGELVGQLVMDGITVYAM